MAHERNCIVCGKQYNYCPKCAQYSNMEKWHIEYCSEQCKNTYSTINKYTFKHIDKEMAKTLLEGNGITNNSNLIPRWKEIVNDILKTEEKKTVVKETVKKSAPKRVARKKKDKNIVNED